MTDAMRQTRGGWFSQARLGLFLHYGLYSLLGRGEQVLFREHLPHSEYRALTRRFAPREDAADRWAAVASEAGMKYAVLTTKHCDGFCLFDTATTSYNLKRTLGRDLVAEYVEALRRRGLRVGLYFSLIDWNEPAYFLGPERDPAGFRAFLQRVHGQIRELAANYGPVDEFWFDGDPGNWGAEGYPGDPALWGSAEILATLRQVQPQALVNERLGVRADILTSEQRVGRREGTELSETCMTSQARWWGYVANDRWRADGEVIAQLCAAAENDSNYLLNAGPMGDGSLPPQFLSLASALGRWMRKHGDAIYGAEPNPGLDTQTFGRVTCKGSRLFMHMTCWPEGPINLFGLRNRVLEARVMASGQPLGVRQREGSAELLHKGPPEDVAGGVHVIEVLLDAPPRLTDWARLHLWTCRDKSSFARWVQDS